MNYATIYTDINIIQYKGNIMERMCGICFLSELVIPFYKNKKWKNCIACCNQLRREKYKKSLCRYCKIEFRPGVQGRYKFCSENCRFMDKVKIDVINGCWLWQGHIQKKKGGYGTFAPIGQKSGLAHRASFNLFKGQLDNNLLVLHSCHNPICVAPSHLRQGTCMDNTLDRKKAGRTTNHGKKL